jgi:hypothetical protein
MATDHSAHLAAEIVRDTHDSARTSGATVTIVHDRTRRLTKSVELGADGALVIEGGAMVVAGGFRTVRAETPRALVSIIEHLESNEALIHGVARNGDMTGLLATKAAIAAGLARNARAKTKNNFRFAEDRPGILMLDLDLKDAPSWVAPTSIEDARSRLIGIAPELAAVPMLALPSASANIFKSGTDDCLRGLTGIRIYVWLQCAADIPEIGRRLHERLILRGQVFAKVTAAGAVHVASAIDTTVWTPERLDYAAGALCGNGIEQRRGAQLWNDDAPPLSRDAISPLSDDERNDLQLIEETIRASAQAKAKPVRAARATARKAQGRETDVTWSSSGTVQHLDGKHEVQLANGDWINVDEILQQPELFEGAQCYDPLEPDYDGGRLVAMIYAGNRLIHSKAHGGVNYPLRASAENEFAVDSEAISRTSRSRQSSGVPTIAGFNSRFAFVRGLGAILHTPSSGKWELMRMPQWRDYTRNAQVFDGRKMVAFSEVWLGSTERRTISRLVFEPELPPLAMVADSDLPAFNIWPGLAMEPSRAGSCERFLRHLRDVVADGDERAFRWVLMWLAAIVQSPGKLPGTALVLQGAQGAGKDTVGEVMREILGDTLHTTIADPTHLTGRFNASHEGKILLQVEEGFFAGNRGDRGKLKHMITASTVKIERKGIDASDVRNCGRLLITSNELWVVPAEAGDRRFMVLKVNDSHANDLAYHRALRDEMFQQGGCERFLHYLLDEVTVDWDVIRRPLATKALRDQQIASLDADRAWLLDLLDAGVLPGDAHGEGVVFKDTLLTTYVEARSDRRTSKTRLTQFLRSFGIDSIRPLVDGIRIRAYQFPPLSVCRERFSRELAVKPDWDDQSDWASSSAGAEFCQPVRKAS